MRRTLVAGNWKMNGSTASVAALAAGVRDGVAGLDAVDVALIPPFPYLAQVCKAVAGSAIEVGAQDVSVHESGAYTGETSAAMVADIGATLTLVGHSERRQYHGESSEMVAAKAAAALAAGLTAVVCVGETLAQREAGDTESVVAGQLDAVLEKIGADALNNCVLAYEPVWAIGTGVTASPQQAQDVHAFIRSKLAAADATMAGQIRILYGGSVKGANAAELFAMDDIDGGLIGGASLSPDDFLPICRA